MAETLVIYDALVADEAGGLYRPRACGRLREDGLWEAWLEFEPVSGAATVGSARETTQPNRDDVLYWAQGLTATYLEGALQRALRPVRRAPAIFAEPPAFERPPGERVAEAGRATPRAVLDPFHVFAEGDTVLYDQLLALSDAQVRNIAEAYGLIDSAEAVRLTRPELAAEIVASVRSRLQSG